MDLQRGSDAEQEVRPSAELPRPVHRLLGQELSEQDDVRLHLAGAAHTRGDSLVVEQRLNPIELEAGIAAGAARAGDRPMHLDHLPGPSVVMKPVDVLGDHRIEQLVPLELDQRLVGRIRPLFGERLESRPVELPESPGVAMEGVDRGDGHRVDLLPEPLPGRAEVGNPRGHGDPGPGQSDRAPTFTNELRETLRRPRARGPASARRASEETGWVGDRGRGASGSSLGGRPQHGRDGRCVARMRSVRQGSGPGGPRRATSQTTWACACRGRRRSPRARPPSRTRRRSRPFPPRSRHPGRPWRKPS